MYLPALRRLNPILKFRLVKVFDTNIKKAPYEALFVYEKVLLNSEVSLSKLS